MFDWKLVSADGQPPVTTSGLPIAVSGRFDAAEKTDVLIAIGGFGTRYETAASLVAGFRRAARATRAVGGIEAGSWLLARAGLLEGRAATTHWEDLEDFAAAFPGADVRPDRYVIDGPVFTAGGASPTFDLMLHLIRARLGMAVALDVASVFIYDQARAATDAQPLVSLGRLDGFDPRLAGAIRLMESHVDRPLTVAAIAKRTGVTARTLEKTFGRADRRDAGQLLSPPEAECRPTAGARHRGADGRHRRPARDFRRPRLSRGHSRRLSASRRRACGAGSSLGPLARRLVLEK